MKTTKPIDEYDADHRRVATRKRRIVEGELDLLAFGVYVKGRPAIVGHAPLVRPWRQRINKRGR